MSKETKLYVNGTLVTIKGEIESIEVEKKSKLKKVNIDKMMNSLKEFANKTESIRVVVEPIIIKSTDKVIRNFVNTRAFK